MARNPKKGETFKEKYLVGRLQIYKDDPGPGTLRIPGPDHFLYDPSSPKTFDEIKVQQIDADGQCSQVIEVWTDPDNGILWVIDGRETLQNIREVNRRRVESGRDPVSMRLAPYTTLADKDTEEKEAVAHMVVRNFHRRLPTPSSYALNILVLHRKGFTWERICGLLHIESDDPKQWCKKRLPIAYCVEEVRAVFDSGELPLSKAPKFGGRADDGSWALSKKDQLALLAEEREAKAQPRESKQVPPSARKRVVAALTNGESESLCHKDAEAAKAIAAALQYVETGSLKALADWPDVAKIIKSAAAKKSEAK